MSGPPILPPGLPPHIAQHTLDVWNDPVGTGLPPPVRLFGGPHTGPNNQWWPAIGLLAGLMSSLVIGLMILFLLLI